MIIVVGEILIDRFPDYERIGGAPFNFAFHLTQLGWPVRFVSKIGDDAPGKAIQRFLEEKHFPQDDIQIDATHPTGTVQVELDAAAIPSFTICEAVAYDHIDLNAIEMPHPHAVEMIYFGTLAQRTDGGQQRYAEFLDGAATSAIRFCDINLRPPHVHPGAVKSALHHADILKLNSEELVAISELQEGPDTSDQAVAWLLNTHDIETVALTFGAHGSRLYRSDTSVQAAPAKTDTIVDTVGAGDAFAAVLAAGRLSNLADEKSIALATRFAADICALPGAIPENLGFYDNVRRGLERTSHGR